MLLAPVTAQAKNLFEYHSSLDQAARNNLERIFSGSFSAKDRSELTSAFDVQLVIAFHMAKSRAFPRAECFSEPAIYSIKHRSTTVTRNLLGTVRRSTTAEVVEGDIWLPSRAVSLFSHAVKKSAHGGVYDSWGKYAITVFASPLGKTFQFTLARLKCGDDRLNRLEDNIFRYLTGASPSASAQTRAHLSKALPSANDRFEAILSD